MSSGASARKSWLQIYQTKFFTETDLKSPLEWNLGGSAGGRSSIIQTVRFHQPHSDSWFWQVEPRFRINKDALGCRYAPTVTRETNEPNEPKKYLLSCCQSHWYLSSYLAWLMWQCITCVMLHWNGNIKLDWKWPFSRTKDLVKEICLYRHFFFSNGRNF